jgi:hypothetical protein
VVKDYRITSSDNFIPSGSKPIILSRKKKKNSIMFDLLHFIFCLTSSYNFIFVHTLLF